MKNLGYGCCSLGEGIDMRSRSEQHTDISDYKEFDIAVRITGPSDKNTDEGFTVTISISKNGHEVIPTFRESDILHKAYEDALSIGITMARQEIDKLD
ncbi:hypothetical protein ACLBW8_06200 [Pseudomonas sp. M5A4_2d]|nr:hypothetical protein [Pseudomonas antarctica]